ncbi:hypothetical protein ACX0G9_12100 [Flavitalea flava]
MKQRVFLPVASLILHLSLGVLTHLSAQVPCDSSLLKNTGSPLSYSNRGDRCEGLYIKEVGSSTLQIVSLTEFFEQYNNGSGKALQMEWDRPPGNGVTRLRAQGIKRRLYYRMDTFQPAGSGSFNWPSNILASLNILPGDIGVLGLTRYAVGQMEQDVYLPLRIKQQGSYIHSGTYKLVLLPGVELSEVYISMALTDPDGQPRQFIKDGEKLGFGYYPAERGIEIPVSGLKGKGTYFMEIGATLRSGGTSTIELWFYKATD